MPFCIMVKMDSDGRSGWFPVVPTNGLPYVWDTELEAEQVMKGLYPDQTLLGDRTQVRVAELEERGGEFLDELSGRVIDGIHEAPRDNRDVVGRGRAQEGAREGKGDLSEGH